MQKQDDLISQFIRLSFIEQKSFKQTSSILNISYEEVQSLYYNSDNKRKREDIGNVRRLYGRKGFAKVPFEKFYDFYSSMAKKCCHCGLTQKEIDQLFSLRLVNTTRQVTRGRSLELERLLPKESYENLENLKLSCYWCNNSKSDEFSEEEFKPIAQEHYRIFKKRISDSIKSFVIPRNEGSHT